MLKAILIDLIPPTLSKNDADLRLSEAESLVKTYGGIVLVKKIQKKVLPSYKTYIGSGKAEEIKNEAQELGANILIVNNELKPMQIYNLGEILREAQIQVWDRIDLILKIFQKHAKTREAKLEIELASIRHMGPRIYGMGMQLTRQGGGIGTRGAGETNLESMKRHLAKQEDSIKKELENCRKVRKLHRDSRQRKNLKTIGIIGYTNAGKSSLLNALTRKGAYVANELFATLDTRVGKLYFENSGQQALISDTIGFIQDLPTTLIQSFQSTLEETAHADLLLHVVDAHDPEKENKIKVVHDILAQIQAEDKPTIYVYNKTDLLPRKSASLKKFPKQLRKSKPCFVSALNGDGIENLKGKIETAL
jgi:GTP-binding protein HflX